MRWRSLLTLFLAGLAYGAEEPGDSPNRAYAWSTFGEGFSSPADGATIDVSSRAHTAPSLTEWRNRGLVVDRLDIAPNAIVIRVGDALDLGNLEIHARDMDGNVIERIPLSFVFEGPDEMLDFARSPGSGAGPLAVGTGRATIWIESLVPSANGAYVREPVTLTVRR
jgi:hypothetical protein